LRRLLGLIIYFMKAILALLLFFVLLLVGCQERPIPLEGKNCVGLNCLLDNQEECKIDVYTQPFGHYGRKSETEQLPFQRANKKDNSFYFKRDAVNPQANFSALVLQWRTVFYAQKSHFARVITQLIYSCRLKFIPNRDKIYLNHRVFRL